MFLLLSVAIHFFSLSFFFFFNDPPTTDIYTLSLHDALPISVYSTATGAPGLSKIQWPCHHPWEGLFCCPLALCCRRDRKSTRLNSSHRTISYAVFCLKKKKRQDI